MRMHTNGHANSSTILVKLLGSGSLMEKVVSGFGALFDP
jgi:hypothetical protein